MRSRYREKIYECGKYLEAVIYPVFKQGNSRRKKSKPTREVQKKLNVLNCAYELERILNKNFTSSDYKLELSFDDAHLPIDDKSAQREAQNVFRRFNYRHEKKNLPPLKYVYSVEKGETVGRYHIHVVMSGGLTPQEIAKAWGRGYVRNVAALQFTKNGLAGIARYMCGIKGTGEVIDPLFYRRWHGSRNLKKPSEIQNDYRIKRYTAKAMSENPEDAAQFEKLYQGYRFNDCQSFYNDINGGYYLRIRMYKPEVLKC